MTFPIRLGGSKWLHDTTARWRAQAKPIRGEDAARKDALSVALYHPHRQGSDDPRLESPLGRFCAAHGLSGHLFNAGVRYREIVLEARQALGLSNPGWSAGGNGYSDGQTDKQILERVQNLERIKTEPKQR